MVNATDRGSLQLYRRLLSYVFLYKGIFAVAVVAMAIGAAMDASFAALIKEITDRGLVEPDAEFIKLIPWLNCGCHPRQIHGRTHRQLLYVLGRATSRV